MHRELHTSLPHVTKSGYEENRNSIVKYIMYITITLDRGRELAMTLLWMMTSTHPELYIYIYILR